MRAFLEIARTGAAAVLLHRVRSAVTVACVVAALFPYLAGIGLARGLAAQAELAAAGPDLWLGGERFGRPAPVPLAALPRLRAVPGVAAVVPRIVGPGFLGRDAVPAGPRRGPGAAPPAGGGRTEGRPLPPPPRHAAGG